MSENKRCPKCNTKLVTEGGRRGEAKAIMKSLVTLRVEINYVCPRCGYREKSQTFIQK